MDPSKRPLPPVKLPELPVVLLTAHGTVPMAVEAMREGAADFLLKPFRITQLLNAVTSVQDTAALCDMIRACTLALAAAQALL
jgi:FixJ family two-component response regulator